MRIIMNLKRISLLIPLFFFVVGLTFSQDDPAGRPEDTLPETFSIHKPDYL